MYINIMNNNSSVVIVGAMLLNVYIMLELTFDNITIDHLPRDSGVS